MRILITGGTGFIGSSLCPSLLLKGHELTVLTRNLERAKKILPTTGIHFIQELKDIRSDKNFEGIINLAGEPIVKRWTTEYKTRLKDSRVGLTQNLISFFSKRPSKPAVWINGSAIGYYGPQGENSLSETDPPEPSFSHELCQSWEAKALEAKDFGCRVSLIRTGIVLGPHGGALAQMRPSFVFGLGGPIGTGQQWMSWIHIVDYLNIIHFCLENTAIEGPINATAPNPVRNRDFAQTFAKVLHRPAFFRVPTFVMRLLFGQMAQELLLSGQKVLPTKLTQLGFKFIYPSLASALNAIEGVLKK